MSAIKVGIGDLFQFQLRTDQQSNSADIIHSTFLLSFNNIQDGDVVLITKVIEKDMHTEIHYCLLRTSKIKYCIQQGAIWQLAGFLS